MPIQYQLVVQRSSLMRILLGLVLELLFSCNILLNTKTYNFVTKHSIKIGLDFFELYYQLIISRLLAIKN